MQSEITFETTETNWVCMIVFLCAHVRISISTYILTRINIIYLPYRLTSKTPLGVVFLFMLVNWLVEKHQLFYSTFTNVFYFCHVFLPFLTFFIIFSWTFFTSMPRRPNWRSNRSIRRSWSTVSNAAVRSSKHRAVTSPSSAARRRSLYTFVAAVSVYRVVILLHRVTSLMSSTACLVDCHIWTYILQTYRVFLLANKMRLTDWLTGWLDWLIDWLTDWLIDWLINWNDVKVAMTSPLVDEHVFLI